MSGLVKKILLSALLIGALAPAPALAQKGPPKPPPGRSFVGAQIDASKDPYKQLIMLSTRVVDGGKNINVWLLGAPAGCGGRSSVGVRKVPIGGQGRFHADLQMGTPGFRRGTATVDGQFGRSKRNGVVIRTVIRARMRFPGTKLCDTGDLRVRALSPRHGRQGQGAGTPAPGALFVGTLKQRSSRIFVQEPMLALISRSGTEVKRFVAVTNVRCKSGRNAGGVFRIRDIDIEDGSFNGVTGNQSSVPGTQEKRTIVLNAKGTFGAKGLTGTWHVREIQTDPYGNTTDDCNTGDLGYAAARGAR